ncbi:MAG: nitroreductase family protein [Rhodoferax sp.]|nr:nitroreductase family protein [Rhodoferax sp.]
MQTPRQTPRVCDHPIHPQFVQRWSARAFSGEVLTREQLFTFLEAARWAPSASNHQPWHFVYALRDSAHWEPLFETLVPFNQSWAVHASALVAVVSARNIETPGPSQGQPNAWHAFDSGAAWYSLALQASLSGWVAHAMGGFDEARLRVVLGLTQDHAVHALVALGRPGDPSVLPVALQERERPNGRRPLAESVHEGRLGPVAA